MIKIGKLDLGWIDLFLIAFLVLFASMLFVWIFGSSPSPNDLTSLLIIGLAGLFLKFNREFGENKVKIVYSFKNVKKDIKEINGRLERIERDVKKINEIERDVKKLKKIEKDIKIIKRTILKK